MGFKLGIRSRANLTGVHPDLVKVVKRALEISPVDFTVTEGLRSVARQRKLYQSGASQTMKSRHIHGFAVDLAPYVGGVRYDWPLVLHVANAMKKASEELGIHVRWGGTWSLLADLPSPIMARDLHKEFPDGPHFELPSTKYPDPR